jgi:hypothetical protein
LTAARSCFLRRVKSAAIALLNLFTARLCPGHVAADCLLSGPEGDIPGIQAINLFGNGVAVCQIPFFERFDFLNYIRFHPALGHGGTLHPN